MEKTATKEHLIRIAKNDDQQAFRELYSLYFPRLFRFCFSLVHSKESAEELVNDVFVNLWKKREQLHKIELLDVYLYVAVKNHSLDHLRSKYVTKEIIDISELSHDFLRFTVDPEQLMITAEMAKKIELAVYRLPPKCKLIFKLIKEDGLPYKKVAAILDISVKTVEAQLSIAMKRIAQNLSFPVTEKEKKRTG